MAIRRLTNSLLAAALLLTLSCGKDKDTGNPIPAAETFLEGTNWVPARVKKLDEHIYLDEKYSVVYVVNFPAPDIGHKAAEGHRAWFYNFDTHQAVDSAAAVDRVSTWHLQFNNIYNSTLNGDATTADGQPGLGKIRVVKTPFDSLTAASGDSLIRNNVPIAFSETDLVDSWGYYTLGTHSLIPYPGRSMIFVLRDGRYVKLQLMNLYKDNPATPPAYEDPNTVNLAPYFNFRYYIQTTPGKLDLKTK
jgi:hypothetical protein